MKKVSLLLAVVLYLTLFTACGNTEKVYTAEDVAGKAYTYEKEGFGGSFTISLFEDGTFHYYEGLLSSYIGLGTWSVEDGVLTMKDQHYNIKNRFRIGKEELIFLAEGSTNFIYLTVEDGDRFLGGTLKIDASSWYGKTKALISLDEVRTIMLHNSDSKVDRVKELLEGFTHEDLKRHWGEPDGMTSGLWSYFWDLDETCSIAVFFDSDGYVSEVKMWLKN